MKFYIQIKVACSCYITATPVRNSHFGGGGNVSILLDDVTCYGNETSLESCRTMTHLNESDIECSHLEDAGVICNGDSQLNFAMYA